MAFNSIFKRKYPYGLRQWQSFLVGLHHQGLDTNDSNRTSERHERFVEKLSEGVENLFDGFLKKAKPF
jgi:hypothetical protein